MSEETTTQVDPGLGESVDASPQEPVIGQQPEPTQKQPTDVSLADVYLPEELRNDPSIKDVKTVTDLAKIMVNAQKLIGREKLVLPGKDATDEEWAQVYGKLGRPESPDNYELAPSENVPEGVIQEERLKAFAEKAHAEGLNTKQARNLLAWYESQMASDLEGLEQTQQQQAEEAIKTLRKEFGNAFDQRIKAANALFVNTQGGEEALEAIKQAGLANNPSVVKWVANISKSFGEDRLIGMEEQARGMNAPVSPQAALAEINRVKQSPAYLDKFHPEHNDVVEKLKRLFADAYPQDIT